MRWITGFIGGLWNFSRNSWVDVGGGLRPRSGASALLLFLFLIFFLIGLILVLLGFDLAEVDRWIDAQAGWLDIAGTLVFKGLLTFVLLICLLMVGGGLFERLSGARNTEMKPGRNASDRPLGCGAMITALIVGYFAWAGLFS